MYAEVIDRFLLLDSNLLISDGEKVTVHRNMGGEAVQRLVALGLMADITNTSPFEKHGDGSIAMTWGAMKNFDMNSKTYKRTEFGEKLAKILR